MPGSSRRRSSRAAASKRRAEAASIATIADVAARAGVSVATVSYVVNETRKVRPETERRVLAAIRDLNYSPNATARNLAVGRSHIFGLLISDIRNPFFPEVTTAFQEAANLTDREAIVMNTNYDAQRTTSCINRLLALRVPGVAVLTSQIDPSIMDVLARNEVCAVYLDLGNVKRSVSNIVIDYEHGIAAALEHVRALGHSRIGFIGGPARLWSAQRRKQAVLECAERVRAIEIRAVDSDFTVEGGYFACAKLLGSFNATAILSANDLMAIGAMHCAYDQGIDVPQDLSIVGFDNILFSQFTQPALTTVAVPRSEIGRTAFQALSAMIADPARLGAEHRVETSLVIRSSTAEASPASRIAGGQNGRIAGMKKS